MAPMGRVVAILNQKGGVGKTTVTLGLASAAGLLGAGIYAVAERQPSAPPPLAAAEAPSLPPSPQPQPSDFKVRPEILAALSRPGAAGSARFGLAEFPG